MNITVTPAECADIAAILEFNRDLIVRYEDPETVPCHKVLCWMQRNIEEHLSFYHRIELDGSIAGYFGFIPTGGKMELDSLFVYPQYRNQGIGTEILRRYVKFSDVPVMLFVFRENLGAVSLYQRHGFQIVEEVSPTRYIMEYTPA